MKIHELKSWPQFFTRVISGEKTFELRVNDRDFKLGDFLFLREYDPQTEQYSGRFQYARITYILGETDHALQHILHPDYVILALSLYWSTPLDILPGKKWVSQLRPEKHLPTYPTDQIVACTCGWRGDPYEGNDWYKHMKAISQC